MNSVLTKLWLWFWHLVPANPILVRVVYGASRRSKHLWLRAGYLGVLFTIVVFSLIASTGGSRGSLAELAKGASQTFKWASLTQLALICFLAPAFTAGAITQERDAQTFNILVSTPITNAQIVFGSLLSRLFFVIMLLVSGLPIFLMTMIYGGVTTAQILESFALSASTAILTGSIAIFIAMARFGTRRTIFSFYLVIALYLLIIYLLGITWQGSWITEAKADLSGRKMSWLTPFHPFLSLQVALAQIRAPLPSDLTGYSAISRWALSDPSTAYVTWTLTVSFVLTWISVFFVRRGAKIGEPTILSKLFGLDKRAEKRERTRKPRHVWNNPIAWREAKTKAAGGGMLRWFVLVGGIAVAISLMIMYSGGGTAPQQSAGFRQGLAAVIGVQFALAMLIATNTAAISMTKEKEARTFELLLPTLLTSKYILRGKLRGLVNYCLPMIAGPTLILLMVGLHGLIVRGAQSEVWIEASIELAALMIAYTGFACVIGLRISLKSRTSVSAVMSSVATVILVMGLVSAIDQAFVQAAGNEFGAFFSPFSPLTAIRYLVDPVSLFDTPKDFARSAGTARLAALIGSILATALYALIVYNIYKTLVREFDMTVRKQSSM